MELTRPASTLQLEFDQYHRYAALALLLKPLLAAHNRPARLLEIYGTALNLLTDFLAPLPLEVTQADLVHGKHHGATILLPQDEPIPLPDQSVDFTIALEALEQVPLEDRTYCVSEWLRVAREGVILSCPLTRGARRTAKPSTNGIHSVLPSKNGSRRKGRHGRKNAAGHPPTASEVRGLLDKLGLPYVALAPVPPAEWLPLLVLLEENHPRGSAKLVGVLQQLLKMRLFRAFTHQRPCRRLFLAWKSADQARAAQNCWFPQQLPLRGPREENTLHPVMLLASRLSASFVAPPVPAVEPGLVEVPAVELMEPLERQVREQRAARERERREQAWREWELLIEAEGFPPEKHSSPALGMEDDAELRGLCPVPANAHLWETLCDNAQFHWRTDLSAGWIRLRLAGRGPHGETVHVTLRGSGWETTILLGRWQGEYSFTRYVFCNQSVTAVSLSPRSSPGPVRIDRWEVQPSTKTRTCIAGFGRLLADGWTVAGLWQTVKSIVRAWRQGGWRGVGRHCLGRAMQPKHSSDADDEPLSYDDWIRHEERIDIERDLALARLCKLGELPLLAVLLPLPPEPDRDAVHRTLHSLAEQSYPRAELLVAVDQKDEPLVREILGNYPTLSVITRFLVLEQRYQSIPLVLNELLKQSRCDYLAPLVLGDQLGKEALLFVGDSLGRNPAADFLYTDEDRWSAAQGRHTPIFKPAWSPDAFIAAPYTGSLAVFRTAACRRAGGFSDRWPQEYELDLICRLAQSDGSNVVHVPKVLYHAFSPLAPVLGAEGLAVRDSEFKGFVSSSPWSEDKQPIPDGFDPLTPNPSPQSTEARGECAVAHHLLQGLWGLRAEKSTDGLSLACKGTPRVSIIIPSSGKEVMIDGKRTTHLNHCLETLRQRTTYPQYEILVVTNGPLSDLAEEALRRHKAKRIEVPPPFHFSTSINAGAKQARGEYLLFLNDDTAVITPDWLEKLLAYAAQPGIGVVGPKLLFPDGRIQHIGVALGGRGPGHPLYGRENKGHFANSVRNCAAVTGACLLTKRHVFEEVNGFVEEFPLNYNDVDYCLKVHQKGLRIVYVPDAELYHYERQRCDGHAAVTPAEVERFRQKWLALYPRDPYDNLNLCPWAGDGRLGRYREGS